jgi:hypothetical protein
MKTLCILFGTTLALYACTASRASYVFPDEMLPHVQEEYKSRCEKGKILYQINCARCHNTVKGRKEIIPEFDPVKLQGYAIRISNAKHEESMPDSLVTEEELAVISDFLKYRKKDRAFPRQ